MRFRRFLFAIVTAAMFSASCQSGTDSRPPDAANATYIIERQAVTLGDGSAEQPVAPGSATKTRTKLWEKQAAGDVSGDRQPDVAVVLIRDPGGSGTFYYLAVVLNDGTGQGKATNAVLLGDRIAVEKLTIDAGQVAVEYLTRRQEEPMSSPPSNKTAKKFTVKEGVLSETK